MASPEEVHGEWDLQGVQGTPDRDALADLLAVLRGKFHDVLRSRGGIPKWWHLLGVFTRVVILGVFWGFSHLDASYDPGARFRLEHLFDRRACIFRTRVRMVLGRHRMPRACRYPPPGRVTLDRAP